MFLSESVILSQGGKKAVIFHSTLYDASLENAAIELATPIFSITEDLGCEKMALKLMRQKLLEDWKAGKGPVAEMGVKFQSTPPSLPEVTAVPEMTACKIVGEGESVVLTIPSDLRQKYLQDPLRAPAWKQILAQFDKAHKPKAPVAANPQAPTTPQAGDQPMSSSGQVDANSVSAFWKDIFPDSPRTITGLEAKGTAAASFPLSCGDLVCKVLEGPEYYICATSAAGSFTTEQAIFTHGAGVWLLEGKASKAIQERLPYNIPNPIPINYKT